MTFIIGKDGWLLKYNNIIKIYSNKILLDSNNNISNYQWHLFQLQQMCNLFVPPLKIYDLKNGKDLTRNELGDLIKLTLEDDSNGFLEDDDILKKYGLISKLDSDNLDDILGGKPEKLLSIDRYNRIVFDPTNNSYIYSNERYADVLEENNDKDKDIADDISRLDDCETGRFINFQSKCYMDTVLLLLLIPIDSNKIGDIIIDKCKQITRQSLTSENLKLICNEIINIKNRLDNLEHFKLTNLVDIFKDNHTMKQFAEQFNPELLADDPIMFLISLFDILDITTESYTSSTTSYITTPDRISNYGSSPTDLVNINSNPNIDRTSNYDTNDKIVFNPYSIPLSLIDLKDGAIDIQSLLCYQNNELITRSEMFNNTYKRIITSGDYDILHDLNKLKKFQKLKHIDISKLDNKTHPIFIDTTNEILYTIDNSNQEYRYIIDATDNCIKTNKGDILAYINLINNVESVSITSAKYLILPISRTQTKPDNRSGLIELSRAGHERIYFNYRSVLPNEILKLERNREDLNLYAIITYAPGGIGHYFGFYKCNDNWYKYNDVGGSIVKIGSFNDLIDFKNDGIENWVMKTSHLLVYI